MAKAGGLWDRMGGCCVAVFRRGCVHDFPPLIPCFVPISGPYMSCGVGVSGGHHESLKDLPISRGEKTFWDAMGSWKPGDYPKHSSQETPAMKMNQLCLRDP